MSGEIEGVVRGPTPPGERIAVVDALRGFAVLGMVLLFQRAMWRRVLYPFVAVGRMALTNYLLQSLICTTLFYGYGLGFYGKVGPSQGLGISVMIFGLQVVFSAAWLRRFRFGPVEWVWRTATYGVSA